MPFCYFCEQSSSSWSFAQFFQWLPSESISLRSTVSSKILSNIYDSNLFARDAELDVLARLTIGRWSSGNNGATQSRFRDVKKLYSRCKRLYRNEKSPSLYNFSPWKFTKMSIDGKRRILENFSLGCDAARLMDGRKSSHSFDTECPIQKYIHIYRDVWFFSRWSVREINSREAVCWSGYLDKGVGGGWFAVRQASCWAKSRETHFGPSVRSRRLRRAAVFTNGARARAFFSLFATFSQPDIIFSLFNEY